MTDINKNRILALLIFLLGFFLRIQSIDKLPALNADEAAIGYNAYSLLTTGKDEHSNPWPLEFQSFNDYKPGIYFYLALPFVGAFGLNVFSVRLPGIILSSLAIPLVYLLGNELFPSHKIKKNHIEINFGIIPSLLLSVSPWHIHFSRGAWETSVATTFLMLGVLIFLKFRGNNKFWLLIPIPFALSMYTYHSMRLIAPLLGLCLAITYRVDNRKLFFWFVLSSILLFPIFTSVLANKATSRLSGIGITADRGPILRAEELRGDHPKPSLFSKVLHNKYVEYSIRLADNYSRHFNGNFLFTEGDEIQRNKVPNLGLLYWFEIITVPFGLWEAIRVKSRSQLLLWWLLIAPLASSLTFQSPNALRAENMIVPFVLLSGLGIWKISKKVPIFIFSIFILWSISSYLHEYYNYMAKMYPYSSQYGFEEMINFVSQIQDKYEQIFITTRYDQPYILTLFYLKIDPHIFQSDHAITPKDKYGFSTVEKFGKFNFAEIKWSEAVKKKNSVIIGTAEEIPNNANIIKKIYFPNGSIAFKIASNL